MDILARRKQIHVFLGALSSTGIISPKNVSGFLWVTRHKFKVCLSKSVLKRVLRFDAFHCIQHIRGKTSLMLNGVDQQTNKNTWSLKSVNDPIKCVF